MVDAAEAGKLSAFGVWNSLVMNRVRLPWRGAWESLIGVVGRVLVLQRSARGSSRSVRSWAIRRPASLTHGELEQQLSVDLRELVRLLYQDHLDPRGIGLFLIV